jgi:Cu-Zn family superoxide dismutase
VKNNALIWVACVGLVFFMGCAGEAEHGHDAPADHDSDAVHVVDDDFGPGAVATLEPKNDSGVTGTATFDREGDDVALTLSIAGATPGEHAFHLHEIGDCSAPDGSSAGGHWNPTAQAHGKWGVSPFHLGDLGNLVVGEDGTGVVSVSTNLWSVGTGDDNDVVGRAVIVHAGVDDYSTQPTGAAGGRIACGVIQPAE